MLYCELVQGVVIRRLKFHFSVEWAPLYLPACSNFSVCVDFFLPFKTSVDSGLKVCTFPLGNRLYRFNSNFTEIG